MPRDATSLRRQLLVWLLLPLTLLWLAGAVAAYIQATNFARVTFDDALLDNAQALAGQVRTENDVVTVDLPQAAHRILHYDAYDRIYFQVRNMQGQVLAGDRELPNLQYVDTSPATPFFRDAQIGGRPVRIAALFQPVSKAPNSPRVLVQAAETLHKRDRSANEILVAFVGPQLLLILLAAILVWTGVSRGLQPLIKLQNAIACRSHRDLTALDDGHVPREATSLVRAINDLMERLGIALTQQQRFIADAAHQLKTPLAGIKAQVELALQENDRDVLRHTLKQLSVSADQANHLATQMLTLARSEPAAQRTEDFTVVDLAEIARNITAGWVPVAHRKRIDLGFECESSVWVLGNPFLLEQMLSNLLDNALRYTQPAGRVTVKVLPSPPSLEVEDNGPGIPYEERTRVFERFHRVLGSGEQGSGLGLSIVSEIATVHSAQIELAEGQNVYGTCMRITFPVVIRR
jgi:two-component system sensor histidine kinase TctE